MEGEQLKQARKRKKPAVLKEFVCETKKNETSSDEFEVSFEANPLKKLPWSPGPAVVVKNVCTSLPCTYVNICFYCSRSYVNT
jgi:hypothetical protein